MAACHDHQRCCNHNTVTQSTEPSRPRTAHHSTGGMPRQRSSTHHSVFVDIVLVVPRYPGAMHATASAVCTHLHSCNKTAPNQQLTQPLTCWETGRLCGAQQHSQEAWALRPAAAQPASTSTLSPGIVLTQNASHPALVACHLLTLKNCMYSI